MVFEVLRLLHHYLTREMRVFEYGAGGSTLYYADRAREVISVESDPAWYARLNQAIRASSLGNVTLLLREPEQDDARMWSPTCDGFLYDYRSSDARYEGFSFRRYVHAIDMFPDRYFDLVVVDGRARCACVRQGMEKVRAGGMLILDNSERPGYAEIGRIPELSKWEERAYFGPGAHNTYFWQTTVWRRPADL